MQKFDGFKSRPDRLVRLPASAFSDLLPLIDDLAELHLTLFCLWAFQQKEGRYKFLRRADFLGSELLLAALARAVPDADVQQVLDAALEQALQRRTLLAAVVRMPSGGSETLYFINSEDGREGQRQAQAGEWQPDGAGIEILPPRPTIYKLYEDNIGPLTAIIGEELKDAEREYGAAWVEEAIRLAVNENVRKWRYVRAILERWRKEGKVNAAAGRVSEPDGSKFISGKYGAFVKYKPDDQSG